MCVGDSVWLGWSGIRLVGLSLQHGNHSKPTTLNLQHTSNQEPYDHCGNSTEQSHTPDDGYINARGWVGVVSVLQAKAQLCLSLQHGYHSNPTQPHQNSNTHRTKNKTTNVVIQQNSRKLLLMDILMSETC